MKENSIYHFANPFQALKKKIFSKRCLDLIITLFRRSLDFFQKYFGRFSVFINLENMLDTRQSRYKGVVNGPHNSPTFDEIWTHTEGRIFNGGIKFKL